MWDVKNRPTGFTIVELLIVIVVIAILAAITIVAYTGIQQRADESAYQSTASQAGKRVLATGPQNNDLFPTTANFTTATGLTSTSDMAYTYVVGADQRDFCVSASKVNSDPLLAFAFTSTRGSTQKGLCVRNLVTNPSFESNTSDWSFSGSSGAPTPQRVNGIGQTGNWAMSIQKDSPVGSAQMNYRFDAEPSQVYSVGFWAWSTSNSCTSSLQFARNNDGFSPFIQQTLNLTTTPQYISGTGTSPSNTSQIRLRLQTCDNSATTYFDSFIVTTSDTRTAPADGSFDGWVWEGATNDSTSFGPAETIE